MRTHRSSVSWIVLLGLSAGLAGCQASGSFQGSASADAEGASASGEAEGAVEAEAEEEPEVQAEPEELGVGEIRYDKGGELRYGGKIHFEYNKAALRDDDETSAVMKSFREFMEKHPNVSLRVEGHTDSRGSDDYNQKLSERRAESVRMWLEGEKVEKTRLKSEGLGESSPRTPEPEGCKDARPEDTTPCEAAWQANRRVEFHVTQGAETIAIAREPEPATPVVEDRPEEKPEPAPPKAAAADCAMLYGVRGELLGPNALGGVAALIQPLCWLELSLGISYRKTLSDAEASGTNNVGLPATVNATTGARWINIPLRARLWLGKSHAFLADVGVAYSDLKLSGAEGNDPLGDFEYDQTGSAWFGTAGVGYGYRQPVGFRFGLLAGLVGFSGSKDDADVNANGWDPGTAINLRDSLDQQTDDVWDLRPYIEASLGWTFR